MTEDPVLRKRAREIARRLESDDPREHALAEPLLDFYWNMAAQGVGKKAAERVLEEERERERLRR